MKIINSQVFIKAVKAITIFGFTLFLGGIACLVAMNIYSEEYSVVEFWYWQRTFMNPIIDFVIKPGAWLFLAGNIGLFTTTLGKGTKKRSIIFLSISILLVVNMLVNLNPIAKQVDQLAILQFHTQIPEPDFIVKKVREDTFGAINLFLLLGCLVIYILGIGKPK